MYVYKVISQEKRPFLRLIGSIMFVMENYSVCFKIICILQGAATLYSSCVLSRTPHVVAVVVSSFQPADDSFCQRR